MMYQSRLPQRTGKETRRLTAARALTEVHLYRPGPGIAAAVALAPGALAFASAVVALAVAHTIPVFLPLLLLLWVLALPAAWLALVSVRTSATGIAVARPWRAWQELPWELIERAEQRGIRYILTASDGRQIAFAPALLRGGARLRREVLVRLPTQVLDARLRTQARDLLGQPLRPLPEGGLAGQIHTRPRAAWRRGAMAALLLGAGALVGGALLWTSARGVAAVAAVAGGLAVMALAGLCQWWLAQKLALTEHGIQVLHARPGRAHMLAWDEIQLVEHTPGERILRLRGERRLTCAGPGLLAAADRAAMRAFLRAYCLDRGVPVVERRWLV